MIGVFKGNNLRPAGICAGKLNRCIVAVGAAVSKAYFCFYSAGIDRSKTFGVFDHGDIVRVGSGVLRTFFQLFFYGLDDDGMTAS